MRDDQSLFERLIQFVKTVFKTNLEIFLAALKLSPNAQGYISGSITELLIKKKLEEEYGFEVKRIREKWEGRKHPRHRGDFYFSKPGSEVWYVVESKGVKSNSEKWHKLYNYDNLKKFMISHSDKIPWIVSEKDIEPQIEAWIRKNLPKFMDEYSVALYEYEEVQRYIENQPRRETSKSKAIKKLADLTREDINRLVKDRLAYLMSKIRVLETHFVSGTSGLSQRTQATPRSDEFNIVGVDVFLRYPEHKFLFANPKLLEPSRDDSNHLQQNYIMGFVFPGEDGSQTINVSEDWYEDFNAVYETLNAKDCVKEQDMQVDMRQMILEEDTHLYNGL